MWGAVVPSAAMAPMVITFTPTASGTASPFMWVSVPFLIDTRSGLLFKVAVTVVDVTEWPAEAM